MFEDQWIETWYGSYIWPKIMWFYWSIKISRQWTILKLFQIPDLVDICWQILDLFKIVWICKILFESLQVTSSKNENFWKCYLLSTIFWGTVYSVFYTLNHSTNFNIMRVNTRGRVHFECIFLIVNHLNDCNRTLSS